MRRGLASSKRLPRSFRVLSAMTTVFGSAMPCRRAARFGVSPTMPLLLSSTRPDQIADYDQPRGNADAGLQGRAGSSSAPTAAINSSPARTARSASSSWACG